MRLLRKWKDNKALKAALVAALVLLASVSVIKGLQNAAEFSQDFQWDAAKALAMRLDPYELSMDQSKADSIGPLHEFYRMFTDRGLKQKMEANQFPSLLVLLFPMTVFSPASAKIVWAVLNLLFTAGIIWFLRKTFFEDADKYVFSVLMLTMIAGTPYRNQLGVGQHTLFAFFFFMLAVFIDKRAAGKTGIKDSVLMTVCLAVSYFKYTLTAPLALYFVYRKRYREFAASVLIHVCMTAGAALWLDKSIIYMISAPLKVASVLVAEGGLDLGVFLHGGILYAVTAVIAAVLVYLAVKLPENEGSLLFSVLILWSLVITYHRTYDFFVFTAAAAMFVPDKGARKGMIVWYASLTVMLYFVLRVFNENTVSKVVCGTMYYAYAAVITTLGIMKIKDIRGRENG